MTSFHAARGRTIWSMYVALLLIAPISTTLAHETGFDHSSFDHLLSHAVSNGLVDYSKFKNSPDFAAYLSSLEHATPESMAANDRLAFWINGYNALVIRNVLDNPGVKKPTDVPGFFDKKKFKIAGKSLTLNEIENDMIRKPFREPLIHFGLVCAALSCPPILPRVYEPKTVRSMLAKNAKKYLASKQNRYDAGSGTLYLSKIFEWYRDDFGGDTGLRAFIRTYGTPQMRKALAANPTLKIASIEYDWTLNSK